MLNIFYGCKSLSSIIIPNSVTIINDDTFYGCRNLQDIVLPDGLTSIGKYAFRYCSNLSTINIPDGVTSIGNYAFDGCSKLNEIVIPNSVTNIGESAFYGCIGLTAVTIPGSVASISNNTFYNCTGLTSLTILDGVTNIGNSAFYSCSGLTSLTIPNTVTSIGERAFYSCRGLTSLTIPYGVKEIGPYAFYDCRNLNSITLPSSLTLIGDKAFYVSSSSNPIKTIASYMTEPVSLHSFFSGERDNIYKDATVYIPFGTTETYKATEGWSNFINFVEMDEGQEEPGKPEQPIPVYEDGDVFVAETEEGIELRYTVISAEDKTCMLGVTEPVEGEWELTAYNGNKDGVNHHTDKEEFTLTIPEEVNGFTVVSIGESALQWAPTLKAVSIPSTVREIGQLAFNNTGISELTIPASVEWMGYQAYISSNLRSITVEEGNPVYDSRNDCNAIIETASNTLVVGCRNTVIVDGVETIGEYSMLSALDMDELHIPKSVTAIAIPLVGGAEKVTVDEDNPVYDSRDNCNAIIETATNTLLFGCSATVIPESVVAIGATAYSMETDRVVIPGNVKTIGDQAFYNSVIKEVTLAEGVEYIGESAFIGDEELEAITIPSTVAYIGSDAFAYCWKGKTVTSYITTPFDVSGVFRFFGSSQEEPTTLYVPYGTKAKYEAAGGWDVFDNIVEMDCDLIVMEKAMQTYTSSYALDFSTPVEGLKAYTVTAVNDKGKAVLTEVTGAVPAGTGLVLMGTAGEQYAVPCVDGALESGDNLLVGVTADTEIGGNDTDYILKDGKFVKAIAGTLPAGKAYLKIDAASAREVIEIEGATTGIGNAVWAASSEGKVYNLNGQRVSQPMRGLYIVNGKKVIK